MLDHDNDQNDLTGTVVGFGQSEDKSKIHETIPRKLEVQIESNDECFLKSYELAKISSNRTFCGGAKKGEGPCRGEKLIVKKKLFIYFNFIFLLGDSGSGLFIKIGSSFFLKGIVSSSLFDDRGNCDVNKFAIYTDVPKFIRWINKPEDPTSIHPKEFKIQKVTREKSCGVMSDETSLTQETKTANLFPWTVAIFVKEDSDLYELTAVGSLVSRQHIVSTGTAVSSLTSWNVLVPVDVQRLKMIFGSSRLGEVYQSGGLIVEGAEKILLHPDIRFENPRSADIAIIFLSSPIFFTYLIAPACLPAFDKSKRKFVGRTGYSVGWGTDEIGEYSNQKKHASLKILDSDTCSSLWNIATNNSNKISRDTFLCAGSPRVSPCEHYDPFYIKDKGKWFLQGLFYAPEVENCNFGDHSFTPVLYEDVSFHVDWLRDLIGIADI